MDSQPDTDQRATPNQEPGAQEVGGPTPAEGKTPDLDGTQGLHGDEQGADEQPVDEQRAERPKSDEDKGTSREGTSDQGTPEGNNGGNDDPHFKYGEDESQDFVDRSKIDFDPEDGLYTGSAVDGDSDIPGPSEDDIRSAQEELGEDQSQNDGEKAAAEKFIEDNDVDLEEAKKGEAIAGSSRGKGRSDGDSDGEAADHDGEAADHDGEAADSRDESPSDLQKHENARESDPSSAGTDDDRPKPFPHDGKGSDE